MNRSCYTYDSLDRLSTVVDNRLQSGQNTTTYTYDPASNVATVTYPNGLRSTFTYDPLNRLTELSTPPVSNYKYTLGLTGIRTGAVESSGRTLSWSYDGIYRLNNETISSDPANVNGSVSYVLDPVGNRSSDSSTITGVTSGTFGYNADDELSTESYDADGNTIATGGKTFVFDSENHLTSKNGGVVTIVYDGDGNRVAKSVTTNGVTVTTRYLVDNLNPTGYPQVMDEVVNGAVQREYTYGLQRISQNQIISGTWTPSFYGYDGFGSVRFLTNVAGTVTDAYEYDAFGNKVASTGTTPNVYLYRGEQYDPDLGLYYLRARYYNSLTGRFLSRDPGQQSPGGSPATSCELCRPSLNIVHGNSPISADPVASLVSLWAPHRNRALANAYVYANSDPVNRIDPKGREAELESSELDFGVEAEVEEAAPHAEQGVCDMLYVEDMEHCSETFLQPNNPNTPGFEACAAQALLNLERCLEFGPGGPVRSPLP